MQGCETDARTVAHFNAHYRTNLGNTVYVELRHSNTCRAKWIRVTSGPSDWGCGGGNSPQVRLRDHRSNGDLITQTIRTFTACANWPIWSSMIGRTTNSDYTQFCFREDAYLWNSDSYYNPCAQNAW
ncbi:DUF2690 domain-containing protein [Nocardioides deserti]|uniref:DUF2690 domain-containing protein n=1 Tax=Nocardioides deserti TaxID=1588644 RepID=A0ABR6UEI8_9ACTN|nr:DUF2690 domain-containing protein [Nocardioides deserti]